MAAAAGHDRLGPPVLPAVPLAAGRLQQLLERSTLMRKTAREARPSR